MKINNKWYEVEESGDYLELMKGEFFETFKDPWFDVLKNFLSYTNLSDNEINVLIIPAFDPEILLKFQEENVILETVTENVFQLYYQNKLEGIETKKRELKVGSKLRNSFLSRLKESFKYAIEYPSNTIVLDGIMYFFIEKKEGKVKIGFKHSPEDHTKIGRLASDLNNIIKLFGHEYTVK